MWFSHVIHLFSPVILTHDSFTFRCDSYTWFIYFHMWFLHVIHLPSQVILTRNSFMFTSDSYTWFIHFQMWFVHVIHLFSQIIQITLSLYMWFFFLPMIHLLPKVILTHNLFIFSRDSETWFVSFQKWFSHTIHLFSQMILTSDSNVQ